MVRRLQFQAVERGFCPWKVRALLSKRIATFLISSFKLDIFLCSFFDGSEFHGGCIYKVILRGKNRGYAGASWKRVAHDMQWKSTELPESPIHEKAKKATTAGGSSTQGDQESVWKSGSAGLHLCKRLYIYIPIYTISKNCISFKKNTLYKGLWGKSIKFT